MSEIDPNLLAAYHAVLEASKASDARWREVDHLLASARALKVRDTGARLDAIDRTRLVADITRLDSRMTAARLDAQRDAYVTTYAIGVYESEALRLREAIKDAAMAETLGRYSASAASHADARVAIAGMRNGGAARVDAAHVDSEDAAFRRQGENFRKGKN